MIFLSYIFSDYFYLFMTNHPYPNLNIDFECVNFTKIILFPAILIYEILSWLYRFKLIWFYYVKKIQASSKKLLKTL